MNSRERRLRRARRLRRRRAITLAALLFALVVIIALRVGGDNPERDTEAELPEITPTVIAVEVERLPEPTSPPCASLRDKRGGAFSLFSRGGLSMRAFAKAFYESPAWRKTRAYILKRDAGLCVRCGAPGEIVHHKTELTPRNIDDPMITLNEDNLETVCRTCHAIIHEGTPPIADGLAFDEDGNVVEAAALPMPPRIRDR